MSSRRCRPSREGRCRADPRALALLQSFDLSPRLDGFQPPPLGSVRTRGSRRRRPRGRRPAGTDGMNHRFAERRHSPPPTLSSVHSHPRCRGLRSPRSHPRESRSVLVVFHHLDGFLRSEVAGLLHPAAGLGFVVFPGFGFPEPDPGEPGAGGSTEPFPATCFVPLEGFPPTAAAPHRWGRCLPAVPHPPARRLRPPPLPETSFTTPPEGRAATPTVPRTLLRRAGSGRHRRAALSRARLRGVSPPSGP
jgi:hypothetical protein